jgi:hypothetical protein
MTAWVERLPLASRTCGAYLKQLKSTRTCFTGTMAAAAASVASVFNADVPNADDTIVS